jgi:hypothetical protein
MLLENGSFSFSRHSSLSTCRYKRHRISGSCMQLVPIYTCFPPRAFKALGVRQDEFFVHPKCRYLFYSHRRKRSYQKPNILIFYSSWYFFCAISNFTRTYIPILICELYCDWVKSPKPSWIWKVPQIWSRLLPFTSFPIHYSLIFLSLYTIYSELLKSTLT